MRGRSKLLWLLAPVVVACAVQVEKRLDKSEAAPETPRITIGHAMHLQTGVGCVDCHDPDEDGQPGAPDPAFCFECHEKELEGEGERVVAYFDAIRQEDGSYRFPKIPYSEGLIVAHAAHAQYEVGCADCHGEAGDKAFGRPPLLEQKRLCMDCHETRGASNDCATCHEAIRKDVAPASHDDHFLRTHGAESPEGWRQGQGGLCAQCHSVPDDCNSCHASTPPPSHRAASFAFTHGAGMTDAADGPWEQTSCALCHEEQSCVRCHQTTKPRSHTVVFERRLHGIAAEIDRDRCETCHKQQFCVNCHETARPVSHRGSWGRNQQSHCIACHEPLNATGCATCHKQTLGHLSATPLPADAPHLGASAPGDCRECHPVLSHLDGSDRCRSCHR